MPEQSAKWEQGLFEPILDAQIKAGFRRLDILAGYATPGMLQHLRNHAKKLGASVVIDLTIGMTASEGIAAEDHEAFVAAEREDEKNISVRYVHLRPAIHSKIYLWSKHPTLPEVAFAPSANFSFQGLCQPKLREETLAHKDPEEARREIEGAWLRSVQATHVSAARKVRIKARRSAGWQEEIEPSEPAPGTDVQFNPDDFPEELRYRGPSLKETRFGKVLVNDAGNPVVLLSLFRADGQGPHDADGVNWGHARGRPRDANEACFCIRRGRGKRSDGDREVMAIDDFFPRDGEKITRITFNVTCHDRTKFLMQREQDGGKALTVVGHKAKLGEWIRECLELPSGRLIREGDLMSYRRTFVTIERRPDGSYRLDFSPID